MNCESFPELSGTYSLLDSGEGARIEQWGDYILQRPASLAIWSRCLSNKISPHAGYLPPGSWHGADRLPDQWPIIIDGVTMLVRCQSNGQVGVFPEHSTYLDQIRRVSSRKGARVLNLFAYTGLASLAAAKSGAEVTHLDLSKGAIKWARENAIENGISTIRFITDDAISFLEREVKRGNRYDLVIADPPSFSRPTAKAQWQLIEVVEQLIGAILRVVSPEGEVCMTSHSYELGNVILRNLISDKAEGPVNFLESRQLVIGEAQRNRRAPRGLPAGFLVWGCLGESIAERGVMPNGLRRVDG